MDYRAFFADVQVWIAQANQEASRIGLDKPEYWEWVAASCAVITRKYNDNRLAIKQMMMLVEWLEEVYESRVKGASR